MQYHSVSTSTQVRRGGSSQREVWLRTGLGFLLLVILLHSLATTTADPDLWGYMAFGRLFWENHQFPYHDVFSYVPTLHPWVYHEWLTGVLFYPLYQKLGGQGLQVLKYVLGLATVGVVYLTARRQRAEPLAAALALFLLQGFLTIGYSPVRAQVFTYFFFTLTLYVLETVRQTGRWNLLWSLVLIQIPWCNLHGGFLSGLGLIALYALGEALSRRPFGPYLWILLLSGLATLINPYGIEYWSYLSKAVSIHRTDITEWASLFRAYHVGILSGFETLYLLTIVVFACFLVLWSRWRDITGGLVLSVTLYLAFKHIRHQALFLILLAAYMPLLLTAYFDELRSRPRFMALCHRVGWKTPTVIWALLMVFYGYRFLSQEPFSLKTPQQPSATEAGNGFYYPVGAVDYIQAQGLSARLLTTFGWGEYALWRLHPQCKVAFDGRYETVYPEEVWTSYFEFLTGRPPCTQFLDDFPPGMVLLDFGSGLYSLFQSSPEWDEVYADQGSILFLRHRDLYRVSDERGDSGSIIGRQTLSYVIGETFRGKM